MTSRADLKVTVKMGRKVGDELLARGIAALTDAADYMLDTANDTAPIEEGTMIRSGHASVDKTSTGATATVGYNSPYVVRQHEDTTMHHDPGRRAKWLELTFSEQATYVGNFLAQAMRV